MRKRTALITVIAMLTTVFAVAGTGMAQSDEGLADRETRQRVPGMPADSFSPRDLNETVQVFIQLDEPSVAEFAAQRGAGTAAQRSQGEAVVAQQNRVASELGDLIIEERSRLRVGANGIRAVVRVNDIPTIRATDGVKSVAQVTKHYPTNETSVPWIGGTAAQAAGYTGDGTTIAIIDTGIDYTHEAFRMPDDTPPPGEDGPPPSFDDVPSSHLFYAEIVWLAMQDITRGCNPPQNTLFCPGNDVSRGQMAAFLNRALDLPPTDEDFFTDDEDSVFEDDINELAAAGITRGCNPPANDNFCPERSITRAEMATFMIRGFGFTDGAGADLFDDDDNNIHESAIDILGTSGVTRGCNPPDNNLFCPDRNIIRGEMAAFIFRAFQAAGLDSDPVPPPPPAYDGAAAYEANDPGIIEPGTFPTEKVIGGFDFAGPTYDASDPDLDTPSPDPDPLDVNGHGTHVAATAAGFGTDEVGVGMAPDAELYAFKVFGDVAGSTDLVSDAIERALDPNNDLSVDDAVDVINMSLGSDFGHPQDPSAISAANAMDLGIVVVASSGNAGTAPYVTGSPAVAENVISVAASVDDGVEVLGIQVELPDETVTMEAQPGDFGALSPATTGTLAVAEPLDGCQPITSDVDGHIALIQRGTCEFTVKVRNAENAGAVGVVLFNNVPEPPIAPGHNGTDPKPTIPAVMVSQADGQTLQSAAASGTVTVTLSDEITIPKPELTDTVADFSSWGPGWGNIFKPDLSAPGFSIFSADVGTGDGGALASGTSMAAPHVAGAVAQILDWNGDLNPQEVKALLMNSATPANVAVAPNGEFVAGEVPISSQGTGVIHVDRIVQDLGGYAMPGGVAFHFNPTETVSDSATIDVTRLPGKGNATYDVTFRANQELDGVTWDVPSAVSTPGGSGSFDIEVTVDPTQLESDDAFFSQTESDGWVVLTNQSDRADEIVVGVVAVADPASTVTVEPDNGEVVVSNDGPGDGFADGFTLLDAGTESPAEIGFRTGFVSEEDDPDFGPYDTIDFGLALSDVWPSPSGLEVDIFIDVDQDGEDDYVLVAADLGLLQGVDPVGVVVTALIDLDDGSALLLYEALADLNDRVIVLPADLTGDFGFVQNGNNEFDITVTVFDQLGLVGVSESVTVDLGAEIEGDLSVAVEAGDSETVDVDGNGEMLWLFPNNQADDQVQVIDVGGQPN